MHSTENSMIPTLVHTSTAIRVQIPFIRALFPMPAECFVHLRGCAVKIKLVFKPIWRFTYPSIHSHLNLYSHRQTLLQTFEMFMDFSVSISHNQLFWELTVISFYESIIIHRPSWNKWTKIRICVVDYQKYDSSHIIVTELRETYSF